MGRTRRSKKPDHSRCKKHPKHKQSPGVCSICLNERLSRLQAMSNTRVFTTLTAEYNSSSSPSSLSSYYSSESASSCSSPPSARYRYRTRDYQGTKSSSLSLLLRKSRSLAFVPRFGGYKDKEGGFWSKLVRLTRKRMIKETRLQHSRTVREIKGIAIIH